MSRYFNYLKNFDEYRTGYYICSRILEDILNFNLDLLTEDQKNNILLLKEKANQLQETIENLPSNTHVKIFNDLIKSKYKFSEMGEQVNDLFQQIFDLEDQTQVIVSNLWNKIITPFGQIENGKDFITIGYSCDENLKFTPYENKSEEYNNSLARYCSIFTNNSMNLANSKVVVLFDVNYNNFLTTSYRNSQYKTIDSKSSVRTLKITDNGEYINDGTSNILSTDEIATKSEDPLNTLVKIHRIKYMPNEVILDKQHSNPTGLLLFSNGYDLLFFEYIIAKKLKEKFNLDFKVINKSLYIDEVINLNYLNECLEKSKEKILSLDIDYNELCTLLNNYIYEVIVPLKLNPIVEKTQLEFINNLKEKNKVLKY